MRRSPLAVIVIVALSLIGVAPASAAGEVTTSMPNGVLYDSCDHYDFTYSAALPVGFGPYWNMDFELLGPDGNEVATRYVYGSPPSGSDDFQICDSPNLAGTYTIQGAGEACNASFDCVPITAAPTSFSMRLPKTKTTLKANTKNPAPNQVVRFTIVTKDERPNGYFPTAYAEVALQVRDSGRWRKVGGRETTDSRGREVIEARYTGGTKKVRAIAFASDEAAGSKSKVLKIS